MASNTPTTVEKPKSVNVWEGSFGFPLFHRLSHELDAMFERFGMERPAMFEEMPTTWNPEMEMFTRDNTLFVKVDVPGMKKEEISVEVMGDHLVVHGERKQEKEEKKEGFFKTERSYGSFYRSVPLPEGVKPESAKATMSDGVLEITMPVAKVEGKARKLEIGEPGAVKATKAA